MRKKVLIIDDDEAVRKSFDLALEDSGHQIDTAESGERGIDMQKKEGYDLIFLDLNMPGLNGIETSRKLRKLDTKVYVYIITAFSKEFMEELKALREEGIYFDLFRKPMDMDEIVEATMAVLS